MIKAVLRSAVALCFLSSPLVGSAPESYPLEQGGADALSFNPSRREGSCELCRPSLPPSTSVEKNGDGYAEFKIGYYQFQNGTLRKIFKNGGVNYGGEIGYIFPNDFLGFWLNGFYFQNHGQAIENGPNVRVQLGTIAIGLRFLYRPVEYFDLFAGVGPRIFIPKIKNDSPYVQKWDQRVHGGGAFSAGFTFHSLSRCPRLWIEAFFDYSLFNYNNYPNSVSSLVYDVNFSFWNVGGSVGVSF